MATKTEISFIMVPANDFWKRVGVVRYGKEYQIELETEDGTSVSLRMDFFMLRDFARELLGSRYLEG